MQKLMRMLQEWGGMELEIRRHLLWSLMMSEKQLRRAELLACQPVGEWHIIARSPRGEISIVMVSNLFPPRGSMVYEIQHRENADFKDVEQFVTREEVLTRVGFVLARSSDQLIDWFRSH